MFFSYCVSILIVLIFVFPVVAFDLHFYVSGLPPNIYLPCIAFPLLVRHGWSIHWKPESNQYLLDQRSIERLVYCPQLLTAELGKDITLTKTACSDGIICFLI